VQTQITASNREGSPPSSQKNSGFEEIRFTRENSIVEAAFCKDPHFKHNQLQNYIELYRNVFKDQMHLAFLFSSPLLNSFSSGKQFVLPQLDFVKEFMQIEKALAEGKTNIRYKKMVATLDNLSDVLIKNPQVLHFSGHGVKNDSEHLGKTCELYKAWLGLSRN